MGPIHVDPLATLALSNTFGTLSLSDSLAADTFFPPELLERKQEVCICSVLHMLLNVNQNQRFQKQKPDAILLAIGGAEKHQKDIQQKGMKIYLLEEHRYAPL